jgi:hypothetical protein
MLVEFTRCRTSQPDRADFLTAGVADIAMMRQDLQ